MNEEPSNVDSHDRTAQHMSLSENIDSTPSKLHFAELWIEDNIIEHLSFASALLFAFTCWFFTDDVIQYAPLSDNAKHIIQKLGIIIVIILLIFIILIYVLQQKKKERTSKVEENYSRLLERHQRVLGENNQLNEKLSQTRETIRSLCEGYLYSLANGPLKFASTPDSYERITLYAHDYDHFIPIGRVSFQPDYAKKGRPNYPEGEGCIAQAWKKGWHFANDYPDPETDPENYSIRCRMDGVSDENYNEIGMKSRLYCGYRIFDTSGKRPTAVLIVEATNPSRYTEVILRRIFNEEERRKYLNELTEEIAPIMPSCREAREEGY